MGNESGTWIMYGADWDDPECLHTVDEAIEGAATALMRILPVCLYYFDRQTKAYNLDRFIKAHETVKGEKK